MKIYMLISRCIEFIFLSLNNRRLPISLPNSGATFTLNLACSIRTSHLQFYLDQPSDIPIRSNSDSYAHSVSCKYSPFYPLLSEFALSLPSLLLEPSRWTLHPAYAALKVLLNLASLHNKVLECTEAHLEFITNYSIWLMLCFPNQWRLYSLPVQELW